MGVAVGIVKAALPRQIHRQIELLTDLPFNPECITFGRGVCLTASFQFGSGLVIPDLGFQQTQCGEQVNRIGQLGSEIQFSTVISPGSCILGQILKGGWVVGIQLF